MANDAANLDHLIVSAQDLYGATHRLSAWDFNWLTDQVIPGHLDEHWRYLRDVPKVRRLLGIVRREDVRVKQEEIRQGDITALVDDLLRSARHVVKIGTPKDKKSWISAQYPKLAEGVERLAAAVGRFDDAVATAGLSDPVLAELLETAKAERAE